MAATDYDDRYVLSSLDNALKIMELMMVRDGISSSEIARITRLNRTTVFKILFTMGRRGFVRKEKHLYFLGEKMHDYRQVASQRQSISDVSQKYLIRLWANTYETVGLCALNASGKIVIVSCKFGKKDGTMTGRIGAEMDWYTNAAGKLMLSHCSKDVQAAIISSTVFEYHTDKTILNSERLLEQLELYRGHDVAAEKGENNPAHGDIASPIFNDKGDCVAAVELVYELNQIGNNLEFYKQQVKNTAIQISTELGYRGYN